MSKIATTIFISPEAPPKPDVGAVCNGCGVCCLLEPCPLGVVLSGHRQGACLALRWQPDRLQYRCGAMTVPQEVLVNRWPGCWRFAPPWLAGLLGRWAGRWVAAGIGCDCEVQLERTPARPDGVRCPE